MALLKAFIISDVLKVGDPPGVRASILKLGCSFKVIIITYYFSKLRRSCTVRRRVEVCSLGAWEEGFKEMRRLSDLYALPLFVRYAV